MAIPTWLNTTAADVQTDSRIANDMANNSYDDAKFQLEITRHIGDWSNVVLNRLRKAAASAGLVESLDDDLTTVLNTEQQAQASLALKLLVISALWQNLAGPDSKYANQANDTGLSGGASQSVEKRLTSGEGLLADLEKQLALQGELADDDGVNGNSGVGMSTGMVRDDGYSRNPIATSYCLRR